jgi:hypothetical protein
VVGSLEAALAHLVLVPAEVVAEFVEKGGADFIAVVVFFATSPFPEIAEEKADAWELLRTGLIHRRGAFEKPEFIAVEL